MPVWFVVGSPPLLPPAPSPFFVDQSEGKRCSKASGLLRLGPAQVPGSAQAPWGSSGFRPSAVPQRLVDCFLCWSRWGRVARRSSFPSFLWPAGSFFLVGASGHTFNFFGFLLRGDCCWVAAFAFRLTFRPVLSLLPGTTCRYRMLCTDACSAWSLRVFIYLASAFYTRHVHA